MNDLASQANELESLRTNAPSAMLSDQANELENIKSEVSATPTEVQKPVRERNDVQRRMIPRRAATGGNMMEMPSELAGVVYQQSGKVLPQEAANALGLVTEIGANFISPPGLAGAKTVKGASTIAKTGKAMVQEALHGSVGSVAVPPIELARATAAGVSPEFQALTEKTIAGIKPGFSINQEALQRHADAYSLPKPVQITRGEALQDPALISEERNNRGRFPQIGQVFEQRNKDLIENTQLIREEAAPDVFTVNKAQHGDTIVDAYRAKDATLNADIAAKYKALEDANGGKFPLDGKAFADAAEKSLHDKLKFNHLPAGFKADLQSFKDGAPMTFEKFEHMRSNLAALARSDADGNAKHAGAVVRDALESMPMPMMPTQTVGSSLEGSATMGTNLKELADIARKSAKARFDLIESDPAYKAVVEGNARDNFVDKFVVNADRKDLATLLNNIAHDPSAQQTARAAAIDTLKEAAGIRGEGPHNFSQAGYNTALAKLSPKLQILFDQNTQKQLEALGRTSKLTQFQPAGSYVNNSNTLVGAMAEMAKQGAKGAAEGAANVAAGGVPVGTWFRKAAENVAERRRMNETIKPGAGILLRSVKP